MNTPDFVTINDITALTGYTKAAVTNWRKRHADFPAPTDARRPLRFDRQEIVDWLRSTYPDLLLNKSTDQLPALLHNLSAEHSRRYDAVLRALQLLAFADALPVEAEIHDWDSLRTGTTVDYGLRTALQGPTGPLTAAESTLLEHFTRRLEDTDSDNDALAESIVQVLLGNLSASEPVELGIPDASSSRLLALAALSCARPEAVVYDATCGIGETLTRLAREVPGLDTAAADIDPTAAAITALRLHFAGQQLVNVETHDALAADPFPDLSADIVLSNPSRSARTDSLRALDPRWPLEWKLTGPQAGEAAFILDALAHLSESGRGFVVTSAHLLTARDLVVFRSQLVARGLLEMVIELPSSTGLGSSALWVLRSHGTDSALVIDAKEDAAIDTHLPQWVEGAATALGADPLSVPFAAVNSAAMTAHTTNLTAKAQLHRDPSGEEVAAQWNEAAWELEAELKTLSRFNAGDSSEPHIDERTGLPIEAIDVADRPDFTRAPIVTVGQLIREGVLRTVQCHVRPQNDSSSDWARQVPVLPVGEVPETGPDGTPTAAHESSARVPDDYDAGRVGDIIIPVSGPHKAVTLPVKVFGFLNDFGFAVTSATRVVRVVDDSRIDPMFLLHCINGDWNEATSTSSGVVRRAFKDLSLPLIPLEEQKRYVEYLDRLDLFEDCAQHAIEQSRALKQATLLALRFGAQD